MTEGPVSPQSDFVTLLKERYSHLLPMMFGADSATGPNAAAGRAQALGGTCLSAVPHGTTILAMRYTDGVLMAGDRRATAGFEIADRNIQKVFDADDHSAIAVAGVAGPAVELAKLLRTQLEFYEKVEGATLSLEGKANYLGLMVRQNLPAALQGLVIVPIFAGYDLRRHEGRIFKYDVTGGRYEEGDYFATGSGGKDARGTMKKRFHAGLTYEDAVRAAVEALLDASDEDVATGGFDFVRDIVPTMKIITEDGTRDVDDAEMQEIAESFLEEWRQDYRARRA